MNWLGKVFVVLILIMSLVFMGLAMAVYATHKNWKEVIDGPNGLKAQLEQENQENEQLKQLHNRREQELTAEKDAAERRLSQLESERDALVARNNEIQTELDQLKQERRDGCRGGHSSQQRSIGRRRHGVAAAGPHRAAGSRHRVPSHSCGDRGIASATKRIRNGSRTLRAAYQTSRRHDDGHEGKRHGSGDRSQRRCADS